MQAARIHNNVSWMSRTSKNIQKPLFNKKSFPSNFDNPWVIIHVTFQCSAFPATRPVPSVATWRCRYPAPWWCGLNGGLSRRGDGRNKNDERWMQNKDEKRQVYSTRHEFWFELSGVNTFTPFKSQLFRQGSLVTGGTHAQCCGEFGGSWHHVPRDQTDTTTVCSKNSDATPLTPF